MRRNNGLVLFLALFWLAGCGDGKSSSDELFDVYTARLDGTGMKAVVLHDEWRDMNHARVSPDHQTIVFTRYNKRGANGLATETDYLESEIVLADMEGTHIKSLVPPKQGVIAANGNWTPDGQHVLFISTDNPHKRNQVKRIHIHTLQVETLPIPSTLSPSDPHQAGNRLVFSDLGKEDVSSLWVMNVNGSGLKRLTYPQAKGLLRSDPATNIPGAGDFDAKLSPDGTRVAVMRHMAKDEWHIFVVDVKTGQETDISADGGFDVTPEWSGDGKLLIFWQMDYQNPRNIQLFTVKPDGSDRKKVPLPTGYLYTFPAFFPGEGSDGSAKIIFSARKVPLLYSHP